MNAWFPPEIAPWFALLSFLSVLSVLDRYARQGRYRTLVMSTFQGLFAFGCFMAAGAVLAWMVGQPGYVVYTFALCGAVIGPVGAGKLWQLRHLYEEAELRKTVAYDLG